MIIGVAGGLTFEL